MSERDRKLILERLTPDERHAALMDEIERKERSMNVQTLAQELIESQKVATIEDYGGSVRRYREALIAWADGEGWLDGVDRDELRRWLTHYLTD